MLTGWLNHGPKVAYANEAEIQNHPSIPKKRRSKRFMKILTTKADITSKICSLTLGEFRGTIPHHYYEKQICEGCLNILIELCIQSLIPVGQKLQ